MKKTRASLNSQWKEEESAEEVTKRVGTRREPGQKRRTRVYPCFNFEYAEHDAKNDEATRERRSLGRDKHTGASGENCVLPPMIIIRVPENYILVISRLAALDAAMENRRDEERGTERERERQSEQSARETVVTCSF